MVEEFGGLISSGHLRAGDKLPSVRQLSLQHRISVSTAISTLRELEVRGLAEARPQSGYYVRAPRVRAPEPAMSRPRSRAQAVSVSDLINQLVAAFDQPGAAPLGAALPDPDLLPLASLQRALARLSRSRPEYLARYGAPEGALRLRQKISERYLQFGTAIGTDELLITHGCAEALNLALRATCSPGDSIAIESPCYYGFLQILESLGLKACEVPTHPRDGLSVEALEKILAGPGGRSIKACLVSSNHSNPLGSTMPDAAKATLVQLCKRHNIGLIDDDLYGELHYAGPQPAPLRRFDPDGDTLLCSSFSKTLAPGARVGWIAAGRRVQQIRQLKFSGSISTGALMQEAIASVMEGSGYDRHLRRLRIACETQVHRAMELVLDYFPKGTLAAQPNGGFLLWVELPPGSDVLKLYRQAAAEGIEFAPGPLFSPAAGFGNALRLNCGHRMTPRIERAIVRLGELARSA